MHSPSSSTARGSLSPPRSPSPPLGFQSPEDRRLQLKSAHSQDVFDTISKGRKSYKTLRGGERVWPPELEAALIEGLESYQPDDSRETRLLGRYPLRNRFISDYIERKTGHHRTPKQVGSRLQQLRESGGGRRLQQLLCPTRIPGAVPSNHSYRRSSPLSNEASSSSDSTMAPSMEPPQTITVTWIDILPDICHSLDLPSADDPSSSTPMGVQRPRHLHEIDPTLTFIYPAATISARSDYKVLIDGYTVVHQESAQLALLQPSHSRTLPNLNGRFLYTVPLVPKFWATICQDQNPTQYTITQTVYDETHAPIHSAKYCFRYPEGMTSPQLSGSSYLSTSSRGGTEMEVDDGLRALFNSPNSHRMHPFHDRSFRHQHEHEMIGFDELMAGAWTMDDVYEGASGSDGDSTETDHRSPSSMVSDEEPRSPVSASLVASSSAPLCLPPALSFYL